MLSTELVMVQCAGGNAEKESELMCSVCVVASFLMAVPDNNILAETGNSLT